MRSQHKRSKIIIIKFIRENRAKKVLLIDFKHAIMALIRLRLKLNMLIKVYHLDIKSYS